MEGKAFDHLDPKKHVTDPLGHGAETSYPKHLHKAGVSEDGGPVYVEVLTPAQEADAVADGWALQKPAPESAGEARRGRPPTRRG
jgi:hypothetical protein